MSSIELNRRLIKRAGWGNDMSAHSDTNEALGSSAAEHIINLAILTPGSSEYNQYAADNNLSSDSAQRLYEIGTNLLSMSQDQSVYQNLLSGNWSNVLNSDQAGRAIELTEGGFEAPSVNKSYDVYGGFTPIPIPVPRYNVENGQHIDSALRIASRTPTGALFWGSNGELIPRDAQRGVVQRVFDWTEDTINDRVGPMRVSGADYDQAKRLSPFNNNPYLKDIVLREARGQFIQGLGQGLGRNMDSEFARRMKANLATTHLKNKIDEWAPKGSTMGSAFNSLGHWLLKMFSNIPGYQSIMNWLADRQYGDKFKSLPGTIQDYGRSLVTNPPSQTLPEQTNTSNQPATGQPIASRSTNNMLPQAPTVPNVNDYSLNTARA